MNSQVESLKRLGCRVDTILGDNSIIFNNNVIKDYESKIKMRLKKWFFILRNDFFNVNDYDLIYIRKQGLDIYFLFFIFRLKKTKVILEIPTFPYDQEMKVNIKTVFPIISDRVIRKFLHNYIDSITYFGDEAGEEIFKVPAIRLENGIDVKSIKAVKSNNNNNISLIGVANLSRWHGYDRLIKSMFRYYKESNPLKENIIFRIVGDGPELINLKKLVAELSLEEKVIFYGAKSGKDLDEVFYQSHIGVSSLGRFRSGIDITSDLKLREYTARGIPSIISSIDKQLQSENFVYKVSHDEKEFNMEKLVEWYYKNNFTSESIRSFAEKNLTWETQMNKIL